jgi:molybdate transport system ATP-binding protein
MLIAEIDKVYPSGFRLAVSFRLPTDQPHVTVVFGPSGSGKTTVLRCLAGLEPLTSGRILFNDEIWSDTAGGLRIPPQKRSIGYLFQDYALFPHLTVSDNVGYGLSGLPEKDRAARVAEMLGLMQIEALSQRRPRELSGGQQQRVALARALARRPRLLLLDEPLSALDVSARVQLQWGLDRVLGQLGIPVVLVTHDWAEALALGDELLVISEGKVLQSGPPDAVFSRPAHLAVATAVGVETIAVGDLVRRRDGLAELAVGAALVCATDPGIDARRFYVCIRAEDVTLEMESTLRSSARNHLAGRVQQITPAATGATVTVDAGLRITALVTRRSVQDLNLKEGDAVTTVFKASSVHLIPHPDHL